MIRKNGILFRVVLDKVINEIQMPKLCFFFFLFQLLDSGLLFDGESLGEKIFNDESMNLSVTNLFR